MNVKIGNRYSFILRKHKNFLCLFTKHHSIGIQIAYEFILNTSNEAYRIGCFKIDRREVDEMMPSVSYIACCRIPFTNKIIHASFNKYY